MKPAFSYDDIADAYAAGVDSAPYNALYERPAMLELLPPVSGTRVLDAGCGAGWYVAELARRGAVVSAIDSSAAMIGHARDRFASPPLNELARTVEFRVVGGGRSYGPGVRRNAESRRTPMTDRLRRKLLKTGATATVMAAAPRVFARQTGPGGATMSFYERGPVRIHYQEFGSGFPLLLIAGGGLNSTIDGLTNPFNAIEELKGEYRCIASDLRNANGGQSSGPLEIDRPWDAYTDDHLGLMDHLRIEKFMVMGFCIGGPFIWNLLRRASDRVVAAVLAQPSGSRPEMRDLFYDTNMKGWGPELVKRRPEITMEMVDKFLTRMYRTNADFVFTVTREFVRTCQTPVLILPDDIPAHPYAVAMEAAMLAPKAEVSMFPWKEPKERIPLAVRQIRSFLRAHRPRPT